MWCKYGEIEKVLWVFKELLQGSVLNAQYMRI